MEFEKIMELIRTVSDSNLTAFRYEEDGVRICLKKEAPQRQSTGNGVQQSAGQTGMQAQEGEQALSGAGGGAAARPTGDTEPADAAAPDAKIVKSPLVGVFYTAPAEGAKPYVTVGDNVKKGQVLATVEAMKLMNEIESEFDGVVDQILVQNGQGVGYGEPLFVIR